MTEEPDSPQEGAGPATISKAAGRPSGGQQPSEEVQEAEVAPPHGSEEAQAATKSEAVRGRLAVGGRLIDRSAAIEFKLDGQSYPAFRGDTLSSALLASGAHFVARSSNLHRPRGAMTSGFEEPSALFHIGAAGEPAGQNGTAEARPGPVVELHNGLQARTLNGWPTLRYDLGEVLGALREFTPTEPLEAAASWLGRQAAQLFGGSRPAEDESAEAEDAKASPERSENVNLTVDVLIVGGGAAGLRAAQIAAASGARVMMAEQSAFWGGRTLVDGGMIDGSAADEWIQRTVDALASEPEVVMRLRTRVLNMPARNVAICEERVCDNLPPQDTLGPRRRIWNVRAKRVIMATGAVERPIAFAHNDAPGVMLASAVRDYLDLYGVSAGRDVALFTNNDDAYHTAIALIEAGASEPTIIDVRRHVSGDLPRRARDMGAELLLGATIVRAHGWTGVEAVEVAEIRSSGRLGARETISCDAIAVSGGWSPRLDLWAQQGGGVIWDENAQCFAPDEGVARPGAADEPFMDCAGAAAGRFALAAVLADGAAAGRSAAEAAGFDAPTSAPLQVEEPHQARAEPFWIAPSDGRDADAARHFIDFNQDICVADIEREAAGGATQYVVLKNKLGFGAGRDGGVLGRDAALSILSDVEDAPMDASGAFPAAIAPTPSVPGPDLVRKTPLHGWHDRHGSKWGRVGEWAQPDCYPQLKGDGAAMERRGEAVRREVEGTRQRVGMHDASMLGKIEISGADAAKCVSAAFARDLSDLKAGRCFYGVLCNADGAVVQDGVVARLDDGTGDVDGRYLVQGPYGGAAETLELLGSCAKASPEPLRARLIDVTEQYAQMLVAGPKAREVLEALSGDIDFSLSTLPFMSWTRGELAGVNVRIFRVSRTGEPSFEIAAPAGSALALWETIFEAARVYGVSIFGAQALNVMRTEMGFPSVRSEINGLARPEDLGLEWTRDGASEAQPDRLHLVGLLTEDETEILPEGACAREGDVEIGRATSSCWSPSLKRSIALGLVANGFHRFGEHISFHTDGGVMIRAMVVDRKMFDPERERRVL